MSNDELEAALAAIRPEQAKQRHKGAHKRRIRNTSLRNDRLLRIVTLRKYNPNAGYVGRDFEGKTLLHSGRYIRFPKNSRRQKDAKRMTKRKMRHADVPVKGNYYRRLIDYGWYVY